MKIRYRQTGPTVTRPGYLCFRKTRGVAVVETPPQIRTLLILSDSGATIRVALPYIIHIIEYDVENDGYYYGGLWWRGMAVYFSDKPLNSMTDNLDFTPTDYTPYFNSVCTPHAYDNYKYASVEKLLKWSIGHWYNLYHEIPFPLKTTWPKTIEEVLKFPWGFGKMTLREALVYRRGHERVEPLAIPENATLVDELI